MAGKLETSRLRKQMKTWKNHDHKIDGSKLCLRKNKGMGVTQVTQVDPETEEVIEYT